jgi:hypothetical protein
MAPMAATARSLRPSGDPVRRERVTLADGAATTVYVASHDVAATEVKLAVFRGQAPLEAWCASRGIREAIVGGFFARPCGTPLGEVRTRGLARRHVPFDAPWDGLRACVHVAGESVRIAARSGIPAEPRGDLLQAGPLLVSGGVAVFSRESDAEGFSAGSHQFDSDITDGRYPRAALGVAGGLVHAVVCDGRSRGEAGLTLEELAGVMVRLGCREALNLDGGGSTSLVSGGRLRNRPRKAFAVPERGGRPVSTALLFLPR